VTVEPGRKWDPHRHSGYEQGLYVLSGQGRQAIDGEWHDLSPGVFRHFPDGVTHVLENPGPEPLHLLAIYNPVQVQLPLPPSRPDVVRPEPPPSLREIVSVGSLQRIQDALAEATGLGVLVLDELGRGVTKPSNLPAFCRLRREQVDGGCRDIPCVSRTRPDERATDIQHLCECCCGIVAFSVPISPDGGYLGSVVCGFVLLEPPRDAHLEEVRRHARTGAEAAVLLEAYRQVPVVLNTPLRAAAESLQTAMSSLVESAARETRERLLREYNERLAQETEVVRNLEKALADTQLRLLQAQFSPHFLFNSLNMIASSITAGEPEPERMVYALSDFLRYVLAAREDLVPLREEIQCVTNYLTIQQNRFGSTLHVAVEVPRRLEQTPVPSLVLQPVVENAVVHGLGPRNYEGRISLSARRVGSHVEVEVRDDGVGLPDGLLIEPPQASLTTGRQVTGLGLRLVRQKLQLHYGQDAHMDISSDSGSGTVVVIRIPAKSSRGRG